MLVRTHVEDGVAHLTLTAPERRNALTLELVAELVGALDALEADPEVGAVVVTGEPPAFCAGADLSHLSDSAQAGPEDGLRRIYEGFLRVGRCPLPTLAAVNGAAVGAGMNLALACDLRLAGESARFDARFLQLGIHPGGGHTWMSRRIAGPQAVAATVLFGEVLDGREAERCGLAWRCVPDGDLLDEAHRLARRAAEAPRELVERTKATLGAVASVDDHATAVDLELAPQVWSLAQPWSAERLATAKARLSRR
ncbi:MAG: enoyl-CoA hydratase [Acidimicrobiia bacterium]